MHPFKQTVYQLLTGRTNKKEYIPVAYERYNTGLDFSIEGQDNGSTVTHGHLFLGYSPFLLGFTNSLLVEFPESLRIHIHSSHTRIPLARLCLQHYKLVSFGDVSLQVYQGTNGTHQLLPWPYQLIDEWLYRRNGQHANNVYLPGDLYHQIQIAYLQPRVISLISLGENGQYNLFPTDLHGVVGKNGYIISLRHQGKASAQVSKHKKIVVSTLQANCYQQIFSLGKNHMKELRSRANFDFLTQESAFLRLPLPIQCVDYKELELVNEEVIGIHRLHYFKIINMATLLPHADRLATINWICNRWREKHGLVSEPW